MSAMLSRTMRWHRSSNKLQGTIRRSIARYESTATQATTDSSKSTLASATTAKATDSLSRAASAAGPALKGIGKTLGSIGGRTGKVISFIQRQIPPTIYYARVGLELSKLVFHGQKMTPPPVSAFQSYFQRTFEKLSNPSSIISSVSSKNTEQILHRARNLSSSELAAGAVLVAELLGFFTVGEIIGRFKLIGYKGESTHHH